MNKFMVAHFSAEVLMRAAERLSRLAVRIVEHQLPDGKKLDIKSVDDEIAEAETRGYARGCSEQRAIDSAESERSYYALSAMDMVELRSRVMDAFDIKIKRLDDARHNLEKGKPDGMAL